MDISLAWLNRYLAPAGVTADEADDLLTRAGFPIEGREDLASGDVMLDVEVTSNRGDCLSHLGCAREVAALSGVNAGEPRRLALPAFDAPSPSGDVTGLLTLENRTPEACPLFTARVVTGAKIGPSPAWLVELLESVGQRAINNAVDVTNYITLGLGNPCHVFDRAKLAGHAIVVRRANEGEALRTLDGKDRKLVASDLVVADAERAQSLAGVMGGAESEVDESTTEIVFEMATWDPVTVRTQSRRLNINTDAGYRFQRGIDPRTIAASAERAVALLCELTGGTLAGGVLAEGAPSPEARTVRVRPSRAKLVLGLDLPAKKCAELLAGLEIATEVESEDAVVCTIPAHRSGDLTREADLVEELARVADYDTIPIADRLTVEIKPPQSRRRALNEIGRVMTGMGFSETVTFSFTSDEHAKLFLPEGMRAPAVDRDRRAEEPTLRPSPLTGLLHCRQQNQAAKSAPPGAVRLYEISSVFGEVGDEAAPESVERQNLALLLDVPGSPDSPKRSLDDKQLGLRAVRGAVEQLVHTCHGEGACVLIDKLDRPVSPAWEPDATASVRVQRAGDAEPTMLGLMGLIAPAALRSFELETPVVAAELGLDPLVAPYPPLSRASLLPRFPAIERDLSLIVDEATPWGEIASMVAGLAQERVESCGFIGTFRGKQIGAGKKSVTLRLVFRDPERTLRHEEVDPEVDAVVAEARKRFQAELRA
ncbi:MAG: phenylalanine--tRNA ligase subunit beta [Planctomycetota bacterium]